MKRVLLRLCLAITLTLNAILPSFAAGLIIIDDAEVVRIIPPPDHPVRPPHIWPQPRPIHRFTPLEIKSLKATATIKDQVAQTKIEQEFYNPNSRQLEGTFILPLPKGAHLEKFRMEVNGKMTDAELLSADKAKGIYEEIVRKAKDPALLEYVGRDLLKVRIFPIEPHSTKKIEVSYAQLLRRDSDLVEYKLPLNTTKYCAAPVKNFSLKLEIEAPTSLKTVYSPTHSVETIRKGDKSVTIGLEQEQLTTDKDFELLFSTEKGELGLSFLTYRKPDEDGYFMLIASPGFGSDKSKVIAKDVVFVLDTSGSMSGKKLEQAKKALLFCVNNLNDQDQFGIIRFATETESLFGKITPVSSTSRERAEKFVSDLKTIGGTAINDALSAALERIEKESARPKLIVFLTDGLPTVGDTSIDGILKTVSSKSKGLTRIFTFGVGTDVNTHLLDRIADETRAISQYVLPDEDTEVKLSNFFSKINDPVLADLSLDYGDMKTASVHPGKLPDLFKGQQLIVLGRFKNDGKTTAKLRGKIGEEQKEFSYDIQYPKDNTTHEFIPRLWATRRVGYLLEEIRHRGENGELKEEVTQLAKQYGIVTPYTSYLVTEDQTPALAGPRPASAAGQPAQSFYRDMQLMRRYTPQFSEAKDKDALAANQPITAGRPVASLGSVTEHRESLIRAQAVETSGDAAVLGARYNYSLKSALNEQELLQAPAEVNLFVQTGQIQSRSLARQQSQTQKFVGARTFRFDNGYWVESTAENAKESEVTRVEFDSKEYWNLAAKFPELRDVLALGTQVKFRQGNKIYEVFSKNI